MQKNKMKLQLTNVSTHSTLHLLSNRCRKTFPYNFAKFAFRTLMTSSSLLESEVFLYLQNDFKLIISFLQNAINKTSLRSLIA